MSGATIGGIVGGVVGAFFGPMGANIGFMLGSAIGGYVDPEVIKSQGPKITDAPVQTARDGIPIAWIKGTADVHGNLIWAADIVETPVVTRDDGKGGGTVQEHTDWRYTADYAIGVCRGPIAGYLIIEENNKIVYDARTDAELAAVGYDAAAIQQTRAASAAFLASGVELYLGTEDQLPDSVMEAHLGVGNVSGYHGLAYMRRQGHDITDNRGAISQYRFVVVEQGEDEPGVGTAQWATTNGAEVVYSDNGTNWDNPPEDLTGVATQANLAWGNGRLVKFHGGSPGLRFSTDRGDTWQAPVDDVGGSDMAYIDGLFWSVQTFGDRKISHSTDASSWTTQDVPGYGESYTCVGGHAGLVVVGTSGGKAVYSSDGGATWPGSTVVGSAESANGIASDGARVVMVSDSGLIQSTTNGADWTNHSNPFDSALGIVSICYSAGLGVWVASNGSEIGYSANGTSWTLSVVPSSGHVTEVAANDSGFVAVGSISAQAAVFTSPDGVTWTLATDQFTGAELTGVTAMPCDGTPIPGAPGFYVHDDGTICGPAGGTLTRDSVVVGTIVAEICQREGLTTDQYDVSDLTDVIEGYRIASEGGGDVFIAPLLVYSCADPVEYDGKLWFFKRGRASIAAITMDDLAERDGDALEWERVQEAELLRKNTITYISALATYTPTTQAFERRGATVQAKGEGAMDLPVVADDTTIAQLAEKRLKIAWSENEKCKFSLPMRFSYLTPTDVVTITDANLVAHRVRIMQIEEDSGVLLVEAIKDREAAYDGTAAAVVPTIPDPTPPTVRGPTVMVAFNGPPPNLSADAKAGIWVAVRGMLTGWAGCDLSISFDGGVTFVFIKTLVNQARIGWLRSGITSSSAIIPVQFYGDAEVDTITDDQVEAFQNVWIIRTGENAEFGQSQTSTSNGDGYDLTDTERGLLETSVTSHNADDDFVMVDAACYYIPVDIRYKGFELVLRAASIGTATADNTTTTLVYDPPEIVWDGNGDDDEGEDGPDPDPGGNGGDGTPTARTVGASVVTPSLTAGEAAAAANCAAINAAFSGLTPGVGGIVRIPAGTWWLDPDDPITLVSNSALDLKTNNPTLRAINGGLSLSGSHKDMIQCVNSIEQWEIYGGRSISFRAAWKAAGGTSTYTPGTNEWGHVLYVGDGAHHGTIYEFTGEGGTGDGLSIGRSAHHIHVVNCKFTNNRRNNISSGGDDILIEYNECSYAGGSDGTSPMANIDIEVDGPDTFSAINWEVSNNYLHHATRTGLTVYKSCNEGSIHDNRIEDNSTQGVYAVDADDIDFHDNIVKRNGVQGLQLTGTCTNWDIDGDTFYSNRTRQYGTFADGLDTTTSPTTTQKAKHISIGSSVTGTTYGTNTYGPV